MTCVDTFSTRFNHLEIFKLMAFANYLRLDSLELGAQLCVHLSAHCINENLPKERQQRLYVLHLHLLLLQELTTAFIVSLIFLLCLPPSTYSVQQTKRKEKRRRPLCFFLSLSNMEINQPERLAHFLSTTILLFFLLPN